MLALACAFAMQGSFQYRWFYVGTNLFREEEVGRIVSLLKRASKAGYNGMVFVDSKLQNQDEFSADYERRAAAIQAEALADGIEIIPAVLPVGYADGMLYHDPSLVEGIPVKDEVLTVHGDTAQTDPRSLYANGDFAQANGDALGGMAFQDEPGKATFVDTVVKHGGAASLRLDNPSGNARLVQKIDVAPWHQYRLTFWAKSEGFQNAGEFHCIALNDAGKNVSFMNAGVQATQDWTQHTVVLNSQGNSRLGIYLGVWGGSKGKLWLNDIVLRDAGLLNVIRREGCPLTITDSTGKTLKEGQDFEAVADPHFGNIPWPGEFDFKHEVPALKVLPASRLKDGDQVRVSYYAPAAVYDGQTTICLSEPKTIELEKAEIARVDGLFHPRSFFLSQDEFRVGNWCAACQARKLSPGQILADDIKRSIAMVRSQHPGAKTFVWSDMFDPSHNAVKSDYYLVNGSLEGSWLGLSRDTVVVNWNSGKPKESLPFFAERGNPQILAGYYDGDVDAIKAWLAAAKGVDGIVGIMYTTWVGRYDDLEAFAKAAWGGSSAGR